MTAPKHLPYLTGLVLLLLAPMLAFSARPVHAAGIVGDGTPGSCTQDTFIAALDHGGTVTFNCGDAVRSIQINWPNGIITWPNTVVDGGNLVVLEGWNSRLFKNFYDLTLKNITLRNGGGPTDPGGAIYNTPGATITLDHVTLEYNVVDVAIWGGGAIYNAGSVTGHHVSFEENYAAGGGALYNDTTGVATFDQGSQFIGNVANQIYGGAITNKNLLTLTDTVMSDNVVTPTVPGSTALFSGGAIANLYPGKMTLNNVTFEHNVARDQGGAIYNQGEGTVTGGSFSHGQAWSYGGAIYNDWANQYKPVLKITGVAFNANSSENYGGAIANRAGQFDIQASTFDRNTARFHGGAIATWGAMYSQMGQVKLSGFSLTNNSADDGGAIYASAASSAELAQGTLSGNTARTAAGIFNDAGSVFLTNVTVSGNSATSEGGGIRAHAAVTYLTNVTLSENAAMTGGALYIEADSETRLANTILANSTNGGNCAGSITSSKYSISSDATCALAGTGDHNKLDPRLSALGNFGGLSYVYMLLPDSPAIDGVVGSDAPKMDQRGLPRPALNGYDIGAVERQPSDPSFSHLLSLPLLIR